jgi:Fe-S-cluster containining protein
MLIDMDDSNKNEGNKSINELELQLERSGFFTHSSLSRQAERINEIESFLYGLIDSLLEQELLDKTKFEEYVKRVRQETLKRQEHFHAGIAIRVDKTNGEKLTPVNCEERLHICNAVCCKLNYALSIEEIESGKIKWDLGQPYFIRHHSNGYCTHLDSNKKCCSIYSERPKVCQKYSCTNDERIWKDFEKMELNTEWIQENLAKHKIQLQEIFMIPEEKIEYKSKAE